jgi:ferredoxin
VNVEVDEDRCAGHGVCWATSPEVFDLNDDGYAVVLLPDVPPELEEKVRTAVKQCPAQAISTS